MNPSSPSNRQVTVIGAGVVGMSCALHLLRDGHRVTVVDKDDPGQGCSFGNAAILAPSYCVPLSMPGVARDVPGWLLDPLGPLAIRWPDMAALTPWFLRFMLAGSRSRAEATSIALRSLHENCVDDFQSFFGSFGAGPMIRPGGLLYVYETKKKLAGAANACELIRRRGGRLEFLDGGQVRDMAPGITSNCVGGIFRPDDGQVTSPLGVVQAMADEFIGRGGDILKHNIRDLEVGPEGPTGLVCEGRNIELETLVVAAGALSAKFCKRLGSPVPLVGERGYHVTLPEPGMDIPLPVMSGECKVALSVIDEGLRAAGTAEFASLDAPPDYRRARAILSHAKRLFPALNTEGHTEWMGMRPSMPDSLPVIGPSPHFGRTYFAFGHGHAGLMGSVITGRTIADLIAGRPPGLDTRPFRIDRFSLFRRSAGD